MILITPSIICGSDPNPTYSDKIDHDELEYAIICPNLLVILFKHFFSKNFNIDLMVSGD